MPSGSSRSTATISLLPSYSTRLCVFGRHVVLARDDQDREAAPRRQRAVQLLPGFVLGELLVLGLEDDLRQAGARRRRRARSACRPSCRRLAGLIAAWCGDVAAGRAISSSSLVDALLEAAALARCRAPARPRSPPSRRARSLSAVSSRSSAPRSARGPARARPAASSCELLHARTTRLLEVGRADWLRPAAENCFASGFADAPSP